jgi:hypothetical protein
VQRPPSIRCLGTGSLCRAVPIRLDPRDPVSRQPARLGRWRPGRAYLHRTADRRRRFRRPPLRPVGDRRGAGARPTRRRHGDDRRERRRRLGGGTRRRLPTSATAAPSPARTPSTCCGNWPAAHARCAAVIGERAARSAPSSATTSDNSRLVKTRALPGPTEPSRRTSAGCAAWLFLSSVSADLVCLPNSPGKRRIHTVRSARKERTNTLVVSATRSTGVCARVRASQR